ncbi:hypothetical protein HOT94_gp064 [Gordonia phage Phistory]|uniref:Uncharacterized protein n=1 Tax=Gordonia phage Phistory TaxID=2301694 RepID=A0A385E218_9CAUD|nr:hypothetical protein HOT94_gp064 [Gordonia phage Phistory]AXQ64769.1 hypothetical protein SEA_PHISTORY_64 [Gordonia phage Phistory]
MTVVDINARRRARDLLEIDADLKSIAYTYGYHSSIQATANGYAATLTELNGRRALTVEPQQSIWDTRDHVMCFLAAQPIPKGLL